MMSRKCESRTYNVVVVGLSGTEKEKGSCGIGKSCLINRFVRPTADDYFTDHISVLSQSDFAGRVVNNDHFLFWGETTKTDDGNDFRFNVIEQTEFIDDSSFQSFRIGKTEPYYKRCAACRLQSAEKLAYICKNQLGLEHEFEQRMLPEGHINVDGFLCLFDVSQVSLRPIERQVDYTACILLHLIKTKKPIVLVTTKNDEAYRPFVSEAERLVSRKELKEKGGIPIVETSAHENVNVESAFLTLAYMIDKTNKNRPKTISYAESARASREILEVAKEAYLSLVRLQITDYKMTWNLVLKKLQINSDFVHFVELFGSDEAMKLFRRHTNQLKEEFIRQKQSIYLQRLETVLHHFIPDLNSVSDRSWYSVVQWLKQQEFFDKFFIILPNEVQWMESEYLESNEELIPYDFLEIPAAETLFRNYVNLLRAEQRKLELKKQFRQLLEDNNNICPGKSLGEVAIFFLGRECFTTLSEKDKQEIYEEHQKALKQKVKEEFQELLLENVDLFNRFEHMVTNDDIADIKQRLQQEPRYQRLGRMEDDRMKILYNNIGFIQHASKEHCPFQNRCSDNLIKQILSAKAAKPESCNRNSQLLLDTQDNKLHFLILGHGKLAEKLAHEIQMQCVEDEYMLDGELFILSYRTIDGDLGLVNSSLKMSNFFPRGCFCVYNSITSLEYIRCNLEKVLNNSEKDYFQRLPLVLVLGHNRDASEKDLILFREKGQTLADRLSCPFVDVPSSMMIHSNKHFNEDQIGLAMHNLVLSIKQRSNSISPSWHLIDSLEPDLRILICFMCGDGFDIEIPLSPLLNHPFSYVTTEDSYKTITLETFLDETKHKVEITAASYHEAKQLKQFLYHGYVAVYSVKRKASLANLKAFVIKVSSVPITILAITESGANVFFTNENMQNLLTQGNSFADSIKANFMTTCANFQQQIASYSPFFKKCWDMKSETELSFSFTKEMTIGMMNIIPNRTLHERMRVRPPAMLPFNASYALTKSSNSNSADDSDPVDPPRSIVDHPLSDSDQDERDSSTSFQGGPGYNGSIYEEVYSEISGQDTECLIKSNPPSHPVKHKRNEYSATEILSDESGNKKSTSLFTSFQPNRLKSVDSKKFSPVHHQMMIRKNHDSCLVKAPLATPEPIEFGDYAQVKDAIFPNNHLEFEMENNYASVVDALPIGRLHRIRSTKQNITGSESDSECSSLERECPQDPWINRRQTNYKKKQSTKALSPSDDHQALIRSDQLDKASEGSEEDTAEELNEKEMTTTTTTEELSSVAATSHKQKKKRSVRSRKKSSSTLEHDLQLTWTDSDPQLRKSSLDDELGSKDLDVFSKLFSFGDDLIGDGTNWRRKLRLKSSDKDERQKKDEKKEKEEERRKRSKLKVTKERKSKKKTTSLTLEELSKNEETLVPLFVQKCISFIESEGINIEGLYRVPGNRALVDIFIEKFREDPNIDFVKMEIPVNVVATSLKSFFSELSEPVVPLNLYDELKDALNLPDKTLRLLTVRGILKKLPLANFAVLKFIVTHINRVSRHSMENSMDIKNLSICWWPTLMWPEITSLDTMLLTTKPLEEVLQLLVEQFAFFFYGENEIS